ncbi:putative amino acid ABC transporter, periplasmic binding protein (plasmid) [Legionella adelaidensis]|uniref:Putative amino acid ABC transporter, periplasmic binding protein n=1 Tax=Legionella adelaidensis TaxID=45056 RepID=A0A0W0R541_9GAMM|nr:transporter substrate-binding domain-containing protein [Legionella adelaidensis]KTC66189.1 putative amino acid ABC transporter, periplasmic binding protein [Legionella adelaidensis]VEH85568.1 putative amino acid ABC transporter, periplasmic binding protein [Legionella adelaidensis]
MKRILTFFVLFFLFYIPHLFAQGPTLRVAVAHNFPPFVMRGANSQFYGFDIAMMNYICKTLDRPCRFIPMDFVQLLNAVIEGKADVAVSSITITVERSQIVNFSIPYLPSKSHFLAGPDTPVQNFSLDLINGKRVGVETGTIFSNQLEQMGAKNVEKVSYAREDDIIQALSDGEIDFALVDAEAAVYWQSYTTGILKVIGPPFPHGFGYGIVISKDNLNLLTSINQALKNYIQSEEYKKNVRMYIEY